MNPPTSPGTLPQAGEQYMVKHPSANGGWVIATMVADEANPGKMLVEFPDSSRYHMESLQIGGRILPTDQLPAQAPGQTAVTSGLSPDYEQFRKDVTALNAASQHLFQLPLSVLLVMVERLAVQRESSGSGQWGSFEGIKTFVPDMASFDAWVTDYLNAVQTQESAGQSPE